MKIETKLDLNNDCYFMKDNEVEKGRIDKIEIEIIKNHLGDPKPVIYYTVKYGIRDVFEECFEDREIYISVDECLEELKKKAQLRYD